MCEFCLMPNGKHDSRCPYYSPTKPKYICCNCGNDIYQNERYLTNENGEYIHEECICNKGIDWLINWLGFKFREMEEL